MLGFNIQIGSWLNSYEWTTDFVLLSNGNYLLTEDGYRLEV